MPSASASGGANNDEDQDLTHKDAALTAAAGAAITGGTALEAAGAGVAAGAGAGGDKEKEKEGKKKKPGFIALPLPRPFRSKSRPGTPGEAAGTGTPGASAGEGSAGGKEGKEVKKRFRKSWSGVGTPPIEALSSPAPTPAKEKEKKEGGRRIGRRPKPERAYSLGADVDVAGGGNNKKRGRKGVEGERRARDNDIVGIVMLDIAGAVDLPRLRNSTCFFHSPETDMILTCT
jgi:hypothetical protein